MRCVYLALRFVCVLAVVVVVVAVVVFVVGEMWWGIKGECPTSHTWSRFVVSTFMKWSPIWPPSWRIVFATISGMNCPSCCYPGLGPNVVL